jgi:hypothetical protein
MLKKLEVFERVHWQKKFYSYKNTWIPHNKGILLTAFKGKSRVMSRTGIFPSYEKRDDTIFLVNDTIVSKSIYPTYIRITYYTSISYDSVHIIEKSFPYATKKWIKTTAIYNIDRYKEWFTFENPNQKTLSDKWYYFKGFDKKSKRIIPHMLNIKDDITNKEKIIEDYPDTFFWKYSRNTFY